MHVIPLAVEVEKAKFIRLLQEKEKGRERLERNWEKS